VADLFALLQEAAKVARAGAYPRTSQDPPWELEALPFLESIAGALSDGVQVYEAVVWFPKPRGKRLQTPPRSLGLFAEKWRAELAIKQAMNAPAGAGQRALGGEACPRVIR
jgi:hypothetical protein